MKTVIKAFIISFTLMIICGVAYPLVMTGISQVIFAHKANGSLVEFNGTKIGSELLGQSFTDPRFFIGRVSAMNYNTYKKEDTIPDKNGKIAYTGVSSGSANLAPSNPVLLERVQKDINEFLKANPEIKKEQIPVDLLTGSGSGLDPNISPEAAKIQVPRISSKTGIALSDLENLVSKHTESRQFGVLGEPRVNVLKLNIEIANILKQKGTL
ncbi:potassium-transporting ATPase KdpC subunit [Clostridium polyendosporum]|uniref:Potassium-transporting ATPase KdpC subunit n=1 Tax=Clostridium polyendosporum TaxID=69208 RepID=A0A919S4T1_9CLOT|nr:potassium-transporting ATPase subunit KdpC [Clostridium polyendosporum]GIM30593.1 potassium-transporting ATPase KdpC subunit [Clostridium polyendosporum]